MISNNHIHKDYFWLNEPENKIEDNKLCITTSPYTDFWQRTHYGFKRDNGHCLLTGVRDDFSLSVKAGFYPENQYDQCGLFIRIDAFNWIKTSIEYESPDFSRLGSVVTNRGFSDWATIDIQPGIDHMWYRIQSRGRDFLLEYSADGQLWKQQRITHLNRRFTVLYAGVYACSPGKGSFQCIFDNFSLQKSGWK